MPTRDEILVAARVPEHVQDSLSGLWWIRRMEIPTASERTLRMFGLAGRTSYVALFRSTIETLHTNLGGEVVMEDTERELRRHLPIMLAARGRVLVTGLGLGCVVRGLLANPLVEHIDVVEISNDIMKMCAPWFAGEPRVTIHFGDARTIIWPKEKRWHFAWHDVWDEQQHLALVHAGLLARYDDRCDQQGAWQFPRVAKCKLPARFIGGPRRRRLQRSA